MSNAAQTQELIPSHNFMVKKLKDVKIQCTGGYMLFSGFAIYDIAAGGLVSTSIQNGAQVPWCYDRKYIAKMAIAEGLYVGYQVVKV